MRVAALLFATGCWNVSPAAPAGPVAPGSIVVVDSPTGAPTIANAGARTAQRRERFPLHSVWQGTYICAQGLSAVTLTIDAMRNGTATAQYDFGPVPSNQTVPEGAYTLKGEIHAIGGGGFSAELEADEWIKRPANYFMVGLSLESSDGKTMTGTIRHGSCSDFKTTRIN